MQISKITVNCYRCENCGHTTIAQKAACTKCGSPEIKAVEVNGRGKLVDFTIVYFAPENYKDLQPYTSVLVELENGCRMFGIIKGEHLDIPEGSPVAIVERDEKRGAVYFELE